MKLAKSRRYVLLKNAAKATLPGDRSWPQPRDDSLEMAAAPPVTMDWPAGVPKPKVGLVRDGDIFPYWTKYRNFLVENQIDYEIYDIHRSDWRRRAAQFDLVVWRPMGFPSELDECRRKFYVLERHMGKVCYPCLDEALLYEDKILQYELLRLHDIPVIDTFVSHSREETVAGLSRWRYPAVWKIAAGSGSYGVELVPDRRTAERWVRRAFSFSGRRSYWPYMGQKDYVLVQPLVLNEGFDLRVLVVGDVAVGYYRQVPEGDFRASGMGLVDKVVLPTDAVKLARRAAQALDSPCLAVDMLRDTAGELLVIEVSAFIQMETPEQMMVNGVPGVMVGDECRFRPCRVWMQELALERVLQTRWIDRLKPALPRRS